MTYVLATVFILQKEKVSIHKAKHSYACIYTSTPYPRNIQTNSNTLEQVPHTQCSKAYHWTCLKRYDIERLPLVTSYIPVGGATLMLHLPINYVYSSCFKLWTLSLYTKGGVSLKVIIIRLCVEVQLQAVMDQHALRGAMIHT